MDKSIDGLVAKAKEKNKKKNLNDSRIHLKDNIKLSLFGKIKLGSIYTILFIWVLIILIPVSLIILSAFNVSNPNRLTFENIELGFGNFTRLFSHGDVQFLSWLANSLMISLITMVATVVVVSLTAYAYSRFRFKGKRVSLMSIMLIQMIPSILALVAFYIINQLVVQTTNLVPYATLIVIYTGGAIAGNTFVLKGYLDQISIEIDDSAKIDGCGNFKTYLKIIAPIARPMLAIIALWSFIGPFGDIVLPRIILVSPYSYTLPVGLFQLLQGGIGFEPLEPLFAAGSLITAIPITIVFMYAQRHLVSGLSAGGVKG